jgi:TM2 domain-containing membrane protein YozV
LQVPDEQVGTRVECPDCGTTFLAKALKKRRPRDEDEDEEEERPRRRVYEDEEDEDEEEERPRRRRGRGPSSRQLSDAHSKKIAAGICGILLGGFGVHKFILGFTTAGVITIVVTFFTCGMFGIIPLIEGIIYLAKSDEDFYQTYIVEKKEWF